MFKNKHILITGGSGMIGRQLVKLLLKEKAIIHIADLNTPINMEYDYFYQVDLKNYNDCIKICKNIDFSQKYQNI